MIMGTKFIIAPAADFFKAHEKRKQRNIDDADVGQRGAKIKYLEKSNDKEYNSQNSPEVGEKFPDF